MDTMYEMLQISIVCDEQRTDATLQLLIQQMLQGWPSHCKEVNPALSKCWAMREDISTE